MTCTDDCGCQPQEMRDIAERFLSFHMDGTVVATAEGLGLDLDSLWKLFADHLDELMMLRTEDPHVQAYLAVKSFEDWCMDQLSEAYDPETQAFRG